MPRPSPYRQQPEPTLLPKITPKHVPKQHTVEPPGFVNKAYLKRNISQMSTKYTPSTVKRSSTVLREALLVPASPPQSSTRGDMLIDASMEKHGYKTCKKILEDTSNNRPCIDTVHSIHGLTPLMAACKWSRQHTVRLLLDYGADPNYQRKLKGTTALHLAAKSGNAQIVQCLIKAGATVSDVDVHGMTALDHANETNTCRGNSGPEEDTTLTSLLWSVPSEPRSLCSMDAHHVDHTAIACPRVTTMLKWSKPMVNGGATIDAYEIEYCHMKIKPRRRRRSLSHDSMHSLHSQYLAEEELEEELEEAGVHQYIAIKDATITSAAINNLLPCTIYRFTVRAKNTRGWSDYSTHIDMETTTSIPEGMAAPLVVRQTSSFMVLEWSPPLKENGEPIDRYELCVEYHVENPALDRGDRRPSFSERKEPSKEPPSKEPPSKEPPSKKPPSKERLPMTSTKTPPPPTELTEEKLALQVSEQATVSIQSRVRGSLSREHSVEDIAETFTEKIMHSIFDADDEHKEQLPTPPPKPIVGGTFTRITPLLTIQVPVRSNNRYTYTYSVRAHNEKGWSVYSKQTSKNTMDTCLAIVKSSRTITVAFPKIVGASKYQIQGVTSAVKKHVLQQKDDWSIMKELNEDDIIGHQHQRFEFTLDNVCSPASYYIFRVLDYNDLFGWSAGANSRCVRTLFDVPMAPLPLTLQYAYSEAMSLLSPVPDNNGKEIDHYQIKYHALNDDDGDNNGGKEPPNMIVLPTFTNFVLASPPSSPHSSPAVHQSIKTKIEHLQVYTTYVFFIRYQNDCGWSRWSPPSMAMRTTACPPEPPSAVQITHVSVDRSVTFEFEAAESRGAPIEHYHIELFKLGPVEAIKEGEIVTESAATKDTRSATTAFVDALYQRLVPAPTTKGGIAKKAPFGWVTASDVPALVEGSTVRVCFSRQPDQQIRPSSFYLGQTIKRAREKQNGEKKNSWTFEILYQDGDKEKEVDMKWIQVRKKKCYGDYVLKDDIAKEMMRNPHTLVESTKNMFRLLRTHVHQLENMNTVKTGYVLKHELAQLCNELIQWKRIDTIDANRSGYNSGYNSGYTSGYTSGHMSGTGGITDSEYDSDSGNNVSPELKYTISHLQAGHGYNVRILAVTAVGDSKPSLPTQIILPREVPHSPVPPKMIESTAKTISISFSPITENGGDPVHSYEVARRLVRVEERKKVVYAIDLEQLAIDLEHSTNEETPIEKQKQAETNRLFAWSIISLVRSPPYQVVDCLLVPGSGYEYVVRAINDVGCSKWSHTSTPFYTLTEAPSVPSPPALNGPAGSTSIKIKFLPPAGTKSDHLHHLDYEFKILYTTLEDVEPSRNEMLSKWHKIHSLSDEYYNKHIPTCTINNILPGASFVLKARAKSSHGKGGWGLQSEVLTSTAAPPAPAPIPIIQFVEERSIGVKWDRPPCRGDPITMYELSHMVAGKSWRTMGNWKTELRTSASFYCVPNLLPSSSHSFRVRAYNSFGWGEFGVQTASIRTQATVPAPPSPPKLLGWDGESIVIGWSHTARDSLDNGKGNGSPILTYQIQRLEHRDWEDVGESRPKDLHFKYLEKTDKYKDIANARKFRVRAVNGCGESDWSRGSELFYCNAIFPEVVVDEGKKSKKRGRKKKRTSSKK